MSLWDLHPDVLVVLHGYPPEGLNRSPKVGVKVEAAYRPGLGRNPELLERVGRWAMRHGNDYCYRWEDNDTADGRRWDWHNASALHLLIGHADEINAQ